MDGTETTYRALYRLREELKKEGRYSNGRVPSVCSDDTLRDIAATRPQTLDEFMSIPGVGKTFMDNYAQRFLKVIQQTETESSMKAVPMDADLRETLERLENKLVSINKRNRLLYFAKCQNKKGLDIFLDGRADPREIIWSDRKEMVVADLYHPAADLTSERNTHSKFNTLIRENENERRDKGQNNLYLAYPFIKGRLTGEDFNVRAPLVFIPVSAKRDASRISISQDTDRDILYNTTLIMAHCKFNGLAYDTSLGEVGDIQKETFIRDVLEFFKGQGIVIRDSGEELHRFQNYLANEFPAYESGQLYLDNAAVLGNFSQFSSTIQFDYQQMLDKNEINDLVEELLDTYREEEKVDYSYDGETEIDAPDKDLQISEKEIIYINDLNSSQENVISAIKKSDKLVVKGPPGTGKSQMIASLIADFACSGKTVLMVSEKKTALDVVYSRLGNLSQYAMILDDVGSKELFYSQLQRMVDYNSVVSPSTEQLENISRKIDETVRELQNIASTLYTPDSFGIEPYRLYHLNRSGSDRGQREMENLAKLQKSGKVLGMKYNELEDAHSTFGNSQLVGNLALNGECADKCPALKDYRPSLSSAEFDQMVCELDALLKDVTEFNHKGFFGKLLGKGKMKKKVAETVRRNFTGNIESISDRIMAGNTDGLICDRSLYEDYDKTNTVYSKLTSSEREYFESMKMIGSADTETNDELFDSVLDWHLDSFESKHRNVLSSIGSFDGYIAKLKELIGQKKEISRRQMQAVLSIELSKLGQSKRGQEIKRKIETKRKMSVNKFVKTYSRELFDSVKIWMMTPEVVSEIIPLQKGRFDLAVFDEASQMFVENGIPAILRAKKVVIVGDENQLRPNSVGKGRMTDNSDDDEDDDTVAGNAALEEESLLDLARFRYPCVILNFHYRSKYEELIAFSNYAYYKGRLYVAPNTEVPEEPPIEVIKTYDSVWTNRTSPMEAQRVAELLRTFFLQRRENESVGIITFNTNQRDLIDDRIDELCRADPQFNACVQKELVRKDRGEDTGLFVKNIENVQGDERDVIIFSTTYAKNENGRMMRFFGSLNNEGGENRLNVAVSRAKKKIYIVTSFDPSDLDVSDVKNKGPKYFKKYLQYAHAVSARDMETERSILHSFGDELNPGSAIHFDSDFENQVYDMLLERGLDVDTQVGVGGYRIDLAVRSEGRYILGIECDGKLYHSSKSARERDFHRQNYLESRGWRIYRIWSPNWWKNPVAEIDKIQALVKSFSAEDAERRKREAENPAPLPELPPEVPVTEFKPKSQRYKGDKGVSVTKRISQIKQPRGGFIKPKSMERIQFDDGLELGMESVKAPTVGMVVDYLSRLEQGASPREAFGISLLGAAKINETKRAEGYLSKIRGTDDESIKNACRLVWYDQVYRAGTTLGDPDNAVADESTCESIRIMIIRAHAFFEKYGPVTVEGPTFGPDGYTETVRTGDGDFCTADTIWDFKVISSEPTSRYTLQLAMYYIMAHRSGNPEYKGLSKIGIFNPRLNVAYLLDMSTVPAEIIHIIEDEIICYD
ncbi:hypothetical protein MMALV_15730 [Candidatus Methanomethylophilus alvi Mx1201]|uniref:HRDC domain-containing protein n=3 Tax=Methanomethylophilus alvi TaxID=1291540 RepID=M9SLH8_METAX|nr:AAA domain-containing protein [Methanomethylophilus alvi]AGI86292.1 hypothetical protein MMALV_15730 [Candidatus Methanomethylophilus alvi Mx1201]AYQ55656.1 hypothetical protein BKD89_07620 [Methanomethylophilus alvi]